MIKSKNTPSEIYIQENDESMKYGIDQDNAIEGMVRYVREDYAPSRAEMIEIGKQMTFHIDDRLCPYSREQLRAESWVEGYYFAKHNQEPIIRERIIELVSQEHDKQFKVVTLCGSTRFKEQFMEAQKRLTLEKCIVISVGLFGHSGDNEVWSEGMKEMLDAMHLRKIDMADEIFVINVGGYIGESTKREIAYAESTGKRVNYLEPIGDSIKED